MRVFQIPTLFVAFSMAACSGGDAPGADAGPADSTTTQDAGQVSQDTGPAADAGPQPECVPIQSAFATNAQPILEEKCSKCHGAVPDFGAPISLVTYEDFMVARGTMTVASLVAARLANGSMPPRGEPGLSHEELDTLASWASCGLIHPDPVGNLEATAPVHEAPDEAPTGATRLALTASEFPVGPRVLDRYQTFTFRDVVAEDRFIQRIEVIVDDSRVLHHVTLTYSNGDYLYAWAPGGGAVQFPDGGIRIRPSDVFEVEIHYNNGAGVEGVEDSSGVAIYHAPVAGTEYVQLSPQTWNILVPARSQSTSSVDCLVTSEFTMFAGMPHMHETGSTFSTVLTRSTGEEIMVNSLTGWSFDAQRYYDYGGIEARVGDQLTVTCGYDNQTDSFVRAGARTQDEMCFDFIYAFPASAGLDCN